MASKFFGSEVTYRDLVTWPDMTLGWNFKERCGIDDWTAMPSLAALRAAVFVPYPKNPRGGGQKDPPTRAKVREANVLVGNAVNEVWTCVDYRYRVQTTVEYVSSMR